MAPALASRSRTSGPIENGTRGNHAAKAVVEKPANKEQRSKKSREKDGIAQEQPTQDLDHKEECVAEQPTVTVGDKGPAEVSLKKDADVVAPTAAAGEASDSSSSSSSDSSSD